MRCFIALGTDPFARPLAPWLDSLRADFDELAVTPADNLHLTVAFLGELDDTAVDDARVAIGAAAAGLRPAGAWTMRWGTPGVFPSRPRPRVLWLGVEEGDVRLRTIHAVLTEELRRAGLPVETRPFRPHLTLARVRRPPSRQRLEEILTRLESVPPPPPVLVGSLVLYRSRLGPPAAVHEAIVEARFDG